MQCLSTIYTGLVYIIVVVWHPSKAHELLVAYHTYQYVQIYYLHDKYQEHSLTVKLVGPCKTV